ncbi:hypothetical protein ACWD1Z_13495 [Streptomyces sp. NPDC002784]
MRWMRYVVAVAAGLATALPRSSGRRVGHECNGTGAQLWKQLTPA